MSDEFIREVDEEVRQERYEQLWKRYGKYALAAAVVIVLATAAGVFWKNYQRQERESDAHAFLEAITLAGKNQLDEAIVRLHDLSEKATGGYAMLARLREAATLAQNGDAKAAVIVYNEVADDSDVPQTYRDLARLLAVMQEIGTIGLDDAEARLAPLLEGTNAWRYSARELVAIAALHANKPDRARELLEANADDADAPQGIRTRAAQLLATLDS